MNGMASLSDQAWAEFIATTQASLACWIRPRSVTAAALCACTDGARNNPLKDCPDCGGIGETK